MRELFFFLENIGYVHYVHLKDFNRIVLKVQDLKASFGGLDSADILETSEQIL